MSIIESVKEKRIELIAAAQRQKPIQENKILFWSEVGKRYTCNPRYLSEYIDKHYPGKFDIVWMFSTEVEIPEEFPKHLRVVRYFSKEFFYELATAKYVVCNSRMPRWFNYKRRKGQFYIQTWHSSLRLKAIEADAGADLDAGYVENAKYDSAQISYIISGCKFSSNIFKNSFWYDGKLLETGTPRTDILFEKSKDREELLVKAGLSKDYKYILYAPTFRKGNDMSPYDVDFNKCTATLADRFGGQWKVLYRLHPNIADQINLENLPPCCIDMSKYQDMQELLIISDILMTDYSSSMFDAACLDKLCILYVSDLEAYKKNERNLYFDINELPFVVAENNDELNAKIIEFNENEYQSSIREFNKKTGSFEDGHACERICKVLFNDKGEEE